MLDPIDLEQGSDAWRLVRIGRVTGSRIADVDAKIKTGEAAERRKYRRELIAERLTGMPQDNGYVSKPMQRGIDKEPEARDLYQFLYLQPVRKVGFVNHPRIAMAGCSPDGFVGDDGQIQIKCPDTTTHSETLETEKVAGCYIKQIQWELACTQRAWCDYISFDDRLLDPEMHLKVIRVNRDDELIAKLEKAAVIFLKEVDDKVAFLRRKYIKAAA